MLAAPPDIPTSPGLEPDLTLRYRDGEDGVIDVYLPQAPTPKRAHDKAPSAPLIIALHGGFWRARYDRKHLRPFAVALAAAGGTVALPEFRRVGGGGEWPVIGHDVEAALASIPTALAAQPDSLIDPRSEVFQTVVLRSITAGT